MIALFVSIFEGCQDTIGIVTIEPSMSRGPRSPVLLIIVEVLCSCQGVRESMEVPDGDVLGGHARNQQRFAVNDTQNLTGCASKAYMLSSSIWFGVYPPSKGDWGDSNFVSLQAYRTDAIILLEHLQVDTSCTVPARQCRKADPAIVRGGPCSRTRRTLLAYVVDPARLRGGPCSGTLFFTSANEALSGSSGPRRGASTTENEHDPRC